MSSIDAYGHTIDLEPIEGGGVVTDVLVLCRVVRHNDTTGALEDMLTLSSTLQTTGMVQRGMLAIAEEIASWESPE